MKNNASSAIDRLSQKMTYYVGTSLSLVIHTVIFIGIFFLKLLNWSTEDVLLVLTTAVSLEAIYLAIFIQMSVNRTTESLANVGEDIDDIQEDIDDIQEGISSDHEVDTKVVLKDMHLRLKELQSDIAALQKSKG